MLATKDDYLSLILRTHMDDWKERTNFDFHTHAEACVQTYSIQNVVFKRGVSERCHWLAIGLPLVACLRAKRSVLRRMDWKGGFPLSMVNITWGILSGLLCTIPRTPGFTCCSGLYNRIFKYSWLAMRVNAPLSHEARKGFL